MTLMRFSGIVLAASATALALAGCNVDAIDASNTSLSFERNRAPMTIFVWNSNPDMSELTITLRPSNPWIQVAPTEVKSAAPQGLVRDEQEVVVQVDRSLLTSVGTHEGHIRLSAPGAKPKNIKVSVYNESVVPSGGLTIVNPTVTYSVPYLIEFAFGLRDKDDRAVVGEPNQFAVSAQEDTTQIEAFHGLAMRRGTARQLWLEMVLDYSIAMQQVDGGIAEMEYAATKILLDSLNADALVAVSEFHRDDQESALVTPFNVDKEATAAAIREIQSRYVRGFASGARMYDALLAAIQRFGQVSADTEDARYIVLFSNGSDTSSTAFASQVVAEALARRVRIFAVGFGETIESGTLMSLASLTGGRYLSAEKLEDLQPAFARIVEDLEGQYVVRWASLRRDSNTVLPGITVAFGSSNASHTAAAAFRATNYTGDPLAGRLTLVQSDTAEQTTVFLRANYMPRGIRAIRCWVRSDYPFTASLVDAADDGLLGAWDMVAAEEADGYWLLMESVAQDEFAPFAAFGPMVRFSFSQSVEEPFTEFFIDNTLYTEGQTLNLEN
ncbi:MAG TPA: VWA domain-containing protein [Candidatus Hydrogenedentes bacterium]|nr:VWA domain-containing protein [Candidatus Hydrogenedentota bacterium]